MASVSKELKSKIYDYLLNTSDSNGYVKCSQIEIADRLRCSTGTVSNAITALRDSGLLIVQQGFGKTPTKYKVVDNKVITLHSKESIPSIEVDCYICEYASDKSVCGQCVNHRNFKPHAMLAKSQARVKELESQTNNDKYGVAKIVNDAVLGILKIVEEQGKELQELKESNDKYSKLRDAVLRGVI